MAKTTQFITAPAPGTVINPVHTYTEEQTAQIAALREYAHSIALPESDPYHPFERRWLDRSDTLPRYMRAAKWKLDDGMKRIKGTLEWRREFKPDLIPPDEVKIEAETGKIILNGFDVDGRPIIYMRPGRENTETSPRQLRHLVWVLERAKDMMPPGQESLMIIVDYKSTTLRTNPSISIARKVLTILQQHYVETLGRALVVNLPMLLSFFYKGIAPFLDPITRDKMRFNPDLFELVPRAQLDADFGGEYEFEWDFESYWAQVVEHCGIAPDGTHIRDNDGPAPAPTSVPTPTLGEQSRQESETPSLTPSSEDTGEPKKDPAAALVEPVSS
ncbi:phosphatidylinositol transfer protein PDR16 [Heterobasidion irregulare TC 32-1]|uniref:Phosphatidylinositol transfer protein PDR16 n=1 Tax=Heterobasidion irregulare (strain TC 32-1) TaxID=747525 RepID=W4KL64_HETIT|nr:phosphatidylinositol transfer protein PDR16 [Heterobasidion irregulare TC 32-1]ETW86598.1 phosphatidylinositol transfer protein PDR16 [Heterobasidion irregulare TC 32-1]